MTGRSPSSSSTPAPATPIAPPTRAAAQPQAHTAYLRHVATARWAPRKRTRAGWLMPAQQFYANVLPDAALLGSLSGTT